MNKNVDKMAQTILDPARQSSRCPLNLGDTSVATSQISVKGRGASGYSADGSCNLYLFGNGEVPGYISKCASLDASGAGAAPPFTSEMSMEASIGGAFEYQAPIFFGDASALFPAKVSFADTSTQVGYHMEVTQAPMQVTFSHERGILGAWTWWYRNALGARVNTTTNFLVQNDYSTFSVPTGATAFGLIVSPTSPLSADFQLTQPGGGAHGIKIGNHSSYCTRLVIPDLPSIQIRRARAIGICALLQFRGSLIEAEGSVGIAQFQPSVYPTQFAGATLYDQIVSSRTRNTYTGHIKDGGRGVFIGPNPDFYVMTEPASRYGGAGMLCMTWDTNLASPQNWNLLVDVVTEFTTSLSFPDKKPADFALYTQVQVMLSDLNRMQVNSQNDAHDYVVKLWNKLKRTAVEVATNPKTWYSIAEVGGTVLSLL